MMKFDLNTEVEESVLPDNPDSDPDFNPIIDPDYRPSRTMSSENKLSSVRKRTYDESAGGENEESYIVESFDDTVAEGEGEQPTKKKSGKWPYTKKFSNSWMNFVMFKGWLRPHPNPARAMCMACNSVMNAGKSELERHATSMKHQRRMVAFRRETQAEQITGSLLLEAESAQEDDGGLTDHDPEASDGAYESSSMIHLDMSQQSTSHGHSRGKPAAEPQAYNTKAIVTKPAPPWRATAIVNGHVTRLELSDYKGRYLVLFFYPQDFSAVCPTELHALSDRIAEFRAIQTEVVACSVDSHLTHLAWARLPRGEGGLGNPKIPLLADPTHAIARDYGVLLPELGHSLRAHFIIDRRGILRHSLVNDISVGRSIDEIIRVTQALQHVDDTETGCPADWKPGEPSV